jgi:hypothetical protein
MANEEKRNPATAEESDISKAQSAQQPQAEAGRKAETGEQRGQFETGQQGEQPETGQEPAAGSPDEGQQGETATDQRTDVEGASLESEERGEAESGFVGAKGQRDTSSELIEDEEEDFTPEGK